MRAREWLQPWNGGKTIVTDEMIEPNCQAGTRSHQVHDDMIKELLEKNKRLAEAEHNCVVNLESQHRTMLELEAFKKYADMTPRVLADRVLRLERALKVLSDRYIKIGGKL